MASNRHPAAVEEGELSGSPPTSQPFIPAPTPQILIPTQAPQQHPPTQQRTRRIGPTTPVRKPFLWGVEDDPRPAAFGTVFLVQQTVGPCGARKVGVIPGASPFHSQPARNTFFSSPHYPSGSSTIYSRGHVMRVKPTSWRRWPSTRYTSSTKPKHRHRRLPCRLLWND